MGDFDACRFDFRLDSKNGLMPSKRKKTERIQPSNYSTLFKCKLCGTLFSCRTSLLEHKLTHTEYRSNRSKYECSVCSGEKTLRFSRKDQLREHLSRDHQLPDAQVAVLVGGRNAGVRKARGTNPRKGTESLLKKSVLKKTSQENGVDRKDSLVGETAAQASNMSLPRLEPNRPQEASTSHLTHCGVPSSTSSYLYINFPILISPTSVSGSGDRPDRLIPASIPWPTSPSNASTSTAATQVKLVTENVTNPQCGVMISPNEYATYDFRNAQLRDWLIGRTANSSGNSGTVRQSPLTFGFAESPGKREQLSGSRVLQDLAKELDKNDDQGALDFSLKASSNIYSCHQGTDSDVETLDVVDLSWKGSRISDRSTLPAAQGRMGLNELEWQNDGVDPPSYELETPSNRYREDGKIVGRAIATRESTNLEGYGIYTGVSSADIIRGIGSGLDADLILEDSSPAQREPRSMDRVSPLPRAIKTYRTPAVHSSLPQTSFRKAKSGLSKMVEKLWKTKIGQLSNEDLKCDRMSHESKSQSMWVEDSEVEASASTATQNDQKEESDEQQRADDNLKSFRDSWTEQSLIEMSGGVKCIVYRDQMIVQSSSRSSHTSGCHSHNDGPLKDVEYQGTDNEIIDLTIASNTRRSVTPQQGDVMPASPTWHNFDERGPYTKFCSPSTWTFHSQSNIDSQHDEGPLFIPDDIEHVASTTRSLPHSPTVKKLRAAEPSLFPVASQRRYEDYLWEHLLTDRQPRTGYGSPASDPGCGTFVNLLGSRRDSGLSEVLVIEPESYCPTMTVSGASSPTTRDRLSCSYPNCGKTFKEWRHLKVHLTLHTGEKPLSCYLCRYTCRHRSSMNWHMKSKHRLEKSKTSGNRTVYVDAARSDLVHQETTDQVTVEATLEKVHPLFVENQSSIVEQENEICYPQQGTVFLIEPEGEVFLTEHKNETLLRELRLSLNLLKNNRGLEAGQQPPPEVLTLTGNGTDVSIIQRSFAEDEKPILVTDQCLSRVSGLDMTGRSTPFKDRFAGPELLLKKIIPAPGKDPLFYTSLMRMKYTKHPSNNIRRPRRPIKRRPVPQNCADDAIAVHRCVTCDRVFDSADALWLHGLSDHEDAVHVCRCECCGFEAGNSTELQCHLLSTHGGEVGTIKDVLCSICGQGFSSRTGLNHHLLRQHDDNEVAHQYLSCPDPGCGAVANKGTLKHHLLCPHLGAAAALPGDAGCGPCLSDGEVSLPPSGVSLGPMDERPVTCDYPGCDKSFRELKHLKVHQMQHTDEKPLRCHLCEYSCRQRNSMNWHMKSKHGQDKHVTSDGRTIYI